jgi:hypothetical protein
MITEYFQMICYIFLSQDNTDSSKIAFKNIVIASYQRPRDLTAIRKIILKCEKALRLSKPKSKQNRSEEERDDKAKSSE